MNHLMPRFGILDLLTATVMKLENWRLRHKSSMEFARIDAHTLQDLDITDARRFTEVNKPFWEK